LKFAEIGDFKLESGESIKNCRIGYRTFGKLNSEKNNAILVPTWFGGRSEHLSGSIGENNPLDSNRYFIIVVDALGNGVSSSPSNSIEQPKSLFPIFSIADMVNSQYHLLKNELNINHLYAVYGGSMGGMQVFQWIVSYPDYMKKAVIYLGSPELSSYDLLFWQTQLNAIEMGQKYQAADDDIAKIIAAFQYLLVRTPDYLIEKIPVENFNEHLNGIYKSYDLFNSFDWASQLKAMMQHNISKKFDSMEKAASNVKANLFIIVSTEDLIIRPEKAIEFASLANARLLKLENDCGHLAPGCEWKRFTEEIRFFLSED
jgi:homoserine O-acetyltransferase